MSVTVTLDPPAEPAPARADGLIEIEFGGYRLRVCSGVKSATLRLVLERR